MVQEYTSGDTVEMFTEVQKRREPQWAQELGMRESSSLAKISFHYLSTQAISWRWHQELPARRGGEPKVESLLLSKGPDLSHQVPEGCSRESECTPEAETGNGRALRHREGSNHRYGDDQVPSELLKNWQAIVDRRVGPQGDLRSDKQMMIRAWESQSLRGMMLDVKTRLGHSSPPASQMPKAQTTLGSYLSGTISRPTPPSTPAERKRGRPSKFNTKPGLLGAQEVGIEILSKR